MKTLFDAVDQLENAMSFHRERHAVLAGNIANVDTPGYRPFDLERLAPSEPLAAGLPLAQTDAGHLPAAAVAGDPTVHAFDAGGAAEGADKNAVSMDRELAKLDANRVRYTTSSELAS